MHSVATAAGNATIWKPAPSTSLIAIACTKIVQDVLKANDLPGELFALTCGSTDVGQAIVNSKDVDLVSFTGSEKIGKAVGQQVSGRFGRTILELGGNNAMTVGPKILFLSLFAECILSLSK